MRNISTPTRPRMQRPNSNNPATVPPIAPVVYRSLPVATPTLAANAPLSLTAPVVKRSVQQDVASTRDSGASEPDTIPFPPVPIVSILNGAIWKDQVDLKELELKLSSACSECELRRTRSSCEFKCKARAEDGNEECCFTLNLWSVPDGEEGALGKYLIQVDRCYGCPYIFKQVLSKTFEVPMDCKGPQFFRVPKLPECMCDQGKGIRAECIERAISLATSDTFEQRLQGANVLADLCSSSNPTFVALFKQANGPARLSKLREDPDCCIRRAVTRILAHCPC